MISLAEMASMAPTSGGQYHWGEQSPVGSPRNHALTSPSIRIRTTTVPETLELPHGMDVCPLMASR